MHFTIGKEAFLKGLSRVQGVVEKRNTIPILSNVLIEGVDGEVFLTATDLEVGIKSSYPATVVDHGKVTVAAKKLYEIVKELPDDQLSFKAKENCWIEIRSGKALFNIVGLSADEFPVFPDPDPDKSMEMESQMVQEMIEKTSFSMSSDESKFNLNGIFFKSFKEDGKEILRFVSTDGHRLALIQKEVKNSFFSLLEKGIIFPRKGIFELKKIAEDGAENLKIYFKENTAIIVKNKTMITMRLVDGEFPDYNRVIPKLNEHVAIIGSDIFFHALRRMSVVSSEKSRGVKVILKTGSIELSSSNPELGEAREDMDADYSGPEITIGFNARYLIDILQGQHGEKVRFMIKDNLSPGVIKSEMEDDFLAVVMPMRL